MRLLNQRFPNSYISGVWLHAIDGRKRFIVTQGNHRLAIIAHLKIPKITVLSSRHVYEAKLEDWSLVKSGRYSVINSQKIFDMFFEETGLHVDKLC